MQDLVHNMRVKNQSHKLQSHAKQGDKSYQSQESTTMMDFQKFKCNNPIQDLVDIKNMHRLARDRNLFSQ